MNLRYSVLLFVAVITGFFACKNNDNIIKPTVSSFLSVANASADTLNYYINGTRQNNQSSIVPGGVIVYALVPSGLQNYQFKKAGTAPVLFSVPLTLQDSVGYSLFVTGQSTGQWFYTVDNIPIDTVANFCTIRLVNAAPDAGNLSLTYNGSAGFSGQAFKTASNFIKIPNGIQEIKVYQTSTGTVLKDTTLTLLQNADYTIFSRGLLNGKGSAAFGISTFVNSQQ